MAKPDKEEEVIDIDMIARSAKDIQEKGSYIVVDTGFASMGMRVVPNAYDNEVKAVVGEIMFEWAPKLQYNGLNIVSKLLDRDIAEFHEHTMFGCGDSFMEACERLQAAKEKAGEKPALTFEQYKERYDNPGTEIQARTILE